MVYLFQQFWIFVCLAVLLGLFVSWSTRGDDEPRDSAGWLTPAAIIFAVVLFMAAMRWFSGAFGLVVEVSLMLFAAYIVGCALGCRLGGCCGDGKSAAADH